MLNSNRLSNLCLIKNLINKSPLKSTAITRFYSDQDEAAQDGEEQKPERKFFKKPEVIDGFEVFDVYMNKKSEVNAKRNMALYVKREKDDLARYNRMSTEQDWTNAWPTSSTFRQNAVPLPVRQGYIKRSCENYGLPPTKYGNAELMKIPNFLHLTPPHIKKHCEAIKKFCTPWPNIDTQKHFPIKTTTSTYIYDGPSIRDDRARVVKIEVNINSLNLTGRAKHKFIKLCEHRFNKDTGILTLVADRCPYRNQNEDYANYLLTTLYYEAKNVEPWESEITEEDQIDYLWEGTQSEENLKKLLRPESYLKNKQDYSKRISSLMRKETDESLEAYKLTALKVLEMKKTESNENL